MVELPVFGVVLVGVGPAGGPAASSLTTSAWATTEGGRSVTSAATIDVAAQTMAVDATVAASQVPAPSNRVHCISPECPILLNNGLSQP